MVTLQGNRGYPKVVREKSKTCVSHLRHGMQLLAASASHGSNYNRVQSNQGLRMNGLSSPQAPLHLRFLAALSSWCHLSKVS